ncbi:hypothetical protein bcgnr5406_33250 [Bacillus cereus]
MGKKIETNEIFVLKMVGGRKGLHTRMVEVSKIENDFIICFLQRIRVLTK